MLYFLSDKLSFRVKKTLRLGSDFRHCFISPPSLNLRLRVALPLSSVPCVGLVACNRQPVIQGPVLILFFRRCQCLSGDFFH
jgi:hypothetical protein